MLVPYLWKVCGSLLLTILVILPLKLWEECFQGESTALFWQCLKASIQASLPHLPFLRHLRSKQNLSTIRPFQYMDKLNLILSWVTWNIHMMQSIQPNLVRLYIQLRTILCKVLLFLIHSEYSSFLIHNLNFQFLSFEL